MTKQSQSKSAPYLGQDRGDLTVIDLYEDEGETGPGQRRERQAASRPKEAKALAALAKAAQQEKRAQLAASKLRKRK